MAIGPGRLPAREPPRFIPAALAALLVSLLPAPLAHAASPPVDPFPLRSEGDLHYDVDATTFMRGDSAHVEFHLRLANAELKFRPAGTAWAAELGLAITATDAAGARVRHAQVVPVIVGDETRARATDQVQLVTAQLTLKPGRYQLEVAVTDRKALKRGLIDQLRKRPRIGRARTTFEVPAAPVPGALATSGVLFAWIIVPPPDSTPGPPRIVPNPSRVYGLYAPSVSAYVELYDRADSAAAASYRIGSAIVTASGDTVRAMADTVRARGGAFGHVVRADVSDLPAARYALLVSAARESGPAAPVAAGSFDVVWQGTSWLSGAEDLVEIARFLLDEDEMQKFLSLSAGERETYLDGFWTKHDPTSETAFNELRAEFERRVAYANTHFGVLGKGMLSDRGKTYIRLGEPDDISRHSQPLNRETIDEELRSTRSGQEILRSGAVPKLLETERNRPFEVWTYDQGGRLLFATPGLNAHAMGLTFVFVDEGGWGDYTLRFTSERTKY